ncbi:MAG: hypothetical protein IIA87_01085 [Nanoarchaeota archaeon]|nr:hypothetical protein [Nanoarchaeota archaeon]
MDDLSKIVSSLDNFISLITIRNPELIDRSLTFEMPLQNSPRYLQRRLRFVSEHTGKKFRNTGQISIELVEPPSVYADQEDRRLWGWWEIAKLRTVYCALKPLGFIPTITPKNTEIIEEKPDLIDPHAIILSYQPRIERNIYDFIQIGFYNSIQNWTVERRAKYFSEKFSINKSTRPSTSPGDSLKIL